MKGIPPEFNIAIRDAIPFDMAIGRLPLIFSLFECGEEDDDEDEDNDDWASSINSGVFCGFIVFMCFSSNKELFSSLVSSVVVIFVVVVGVVILVGSLVVSDEFNRLKSWFSLYLIPLLFSKSSTDAAICNSCDGCALNVVDGRRVTGGATGEDGDDFFPSYGELLLVLSDDFGVESCRIEPVEAVSD